MSPPPPGPRAWAEVQLPALRHNLEVARRNSGGAVMACVKANAYGHGLLPIARHLQQADVDFLAVAHSGEARQLSAAGIKCPLFLLGSTLPAERPEILAAGWVCCPGSLEELSGLATLATASHPARLHLGLDTGMGRGGLLPEDLPAARELLLAHPHLHLEGVATHLPVADEDPTFTRGQIATFTDLATEIRDHFPCQPQPGQPFWIHHANSAGLLDYPPEESNLCRPGLLLYGSSPLPADAAKLRPVMTLKSRLTHLAPLPAGHTISYGCTPLARPTLTGVVGIGYADGYPRHLSGQEVSVIVRRQPCPLIGRVSMDQIVIDLNALLDAQLGDEVILWGENPTVADLARHAGTIPWELLTGVTARVERQMVD